MPKKKTVSRLRGTRLCYQKVAQHLDFLGCPQLLRIDEDYLNLRELDIAQNGDKIGVFIGEVIGNKSDADSGPNCILQSDDAVGRQCGYPRLLAVTADRLERADRREMHGRRAVV